jgi:hypothetical protein
VHPEEFFFASLHFEVCKFANMVYLAIAFIVTNLAFIRKQPFDNLIANYPGMKGLLVREDGFFLLP